LRAGYAGTDQPVERTRDSRRVKASSYLEWRTETEDDDLKASPRWHLIQKVLDVDSGAETNRVWVLAIKIG